ncbi:hypothetical protein JXM83_06050 [Candidatus Woesearchaeota archaeon]|nr:hypothetical protein [Candidatus Woesearchaeota archaeon]
MNKKGDGMSLNLVVVAAIALVVLVVLLSVFASKMRQGTQGQETAVKEFNTNLCSQTREGAKCLSVGETGCSKSDADASQGYIDCPKGSGCCR